MTLLPSRAETGYNERDLKLGAALGAGMSLEEAADFADVSRRTVFNRRNVNGEFIDFVAAVVRTVTAASIATSVEAARRKWADYYAKAIDNVGELLSSEDEHLRYKASTQAIDRVEGKTTTKIETSGEIKHKHEPQYATLPDDVYQYLIASVRRTSELLSGKATLDSPSPVIDVIPKSHRLAS